MTQVGPYRLEERLGHGGMGTVHRATDRCGRAVAVKVLHPHIAFDVSSRTRLEREVSTLARVRHPRVASFLDADVDGQFPYIVTEFVPGMPLDERVAVDGPLDGEALHRFVAGVHEALRAIHAVGVVHRDLKPGNVMVDRSGDPVIIDFGIAHIGEESRLTATGLVMGTPGYLAPELIEGGQPTVSTDWWGLGAVLAFAATGRNPYGGGPNEAILARIRRGEHDLRSMDPQWRPLAEACLAVDPGDRPTVAEVREVIARGGGPLPERQATQPLGVQGPMGEATVPVAGTATGATQPVGRATSRLPGEGGGPDPDATQPVDRAATRPLPRAAVSRSAQPVPPPATEGFLQPPAQHRDQPAGRLREPEAPTWGAPGAVGPPGVGQQPGPSAAGYQGGPPSAGFQSRPPSAGYRPGPPSAGYRPEGPPAGWGPAAGEPQPVPPRHQDSGAVRMPRRSQLHPYDPRTRLPRHSWVVLMGSVLAVAATMLWPVATGVVVVAWILVARWADHVAMAHLKRLFARGRRTGDTWRIVTGAPWHLVTAMVRGTASLIAPALLGGATVVAVNFALGYDPLRSFTASGAGTATGLDNALAWGAGAFVTVVCLWWGIDSASLRRGTRLTLGGALRTTAAEVVVALVLGATAIACVLWGLSQGWPTTLAPWR